MYTFLYFTINLIGILIYIIKLPYLILIFLFDILKQLISYIINQFKKDGIYNIEYTDGSYKKYCLRNKFYEGNYVYYNSKSNTLIDKTYRFNKLRSMIVKINDNIDFQLGYDRFERYAYSERTGENEKNYYFIKYKTKYFYDSNNNIIKKIKRYNPKDFANKYSENIFQITTYFDKDLNVSYIENKIINENF